MNYKSLNVFILFFVQSFFTCFASNNDLCLQRNIFFEKTAVLLKEIKNNPISIPDSQPTEISEYNSLLNQAEILLNKLVDNRESVNRLSSLKLDNLFHQIGKRSENFSESKNRFLNAEIKEKFNSIFDLLKKGVGLDLSYDHIANFREVLLSHLKNILFLIEYWKAESEASPLWGTNKVVIKNKIKELVFFRDRTASFVGKVDEIFLILFKIANDPNAVDENTLKQVESILDDVVFCLYCFFSENVDPDNFSYYDRLSEFSKFTSEQKISLLCKNHINVLLSGESLRFQIKDLEMPGFLERHWFAVSLGAVVAVGSGVLIYHNREYLFGGECEKDLISFYEKSVKKWVVDPFVKAKDAIEEKFFPKAYLSEDKDTLTKFAEKLKGTLKARCEGLAKKVDENKKPLFIFTDSDLNDSDKLSNKLDALLGTQADKLFNTDYREIKDLLAKFKEFMTDLNAHLPKMAEAAGLNSDAEASSSSDKKDKKANNYYFFPGYRKTIDDLQDKAKELVCMLEKLKSSGETKPTAQAVLGVIDSFTHLLDKIGDQFPSLVVLFEIILARGCIVGIDGSQRVVGIFNLLEALQRWVPIIVITVIVVVSTKIIVDKITENRIKRVSANLAEVYRLLIPYKAQGIDYFQHDLKYRDQGLIIYWMDLLSENMQSLAKDNRERISRLLTDLQNPELSIPQKLEFIKLEWGKYLFGVPGVA